MDPNLFRLVAVPDTDGEIDSLLGDLEEVLASLVGFNDDPEDCDLLAPPLGDGDALTALRRILDAVHAAERSQIVQPVAPDGRFELIPLSFVTLAAADLAAVADRIVALGRATLPGADELVTDTLNEHARAQRRTPTELVARAARAHGLLDLAPDRDTETLAASLRSEHDRVVLSVDEFRAYTRLTERVLAMFHIDDDTLARFLYRGPS